MWLGINAFLFVHFYMAFLVERWYYTRVLLGVSLTLQHHFCCTDSQAGAEKLIRLMKVVGEHEQFK